MVYQTHLSIGRYYRIKRLFLYACYCIVSVLALGCENSEQEIKAFTEKKIGIDEATMIETYFSQAGKMRAKLTAPVMLRYQDTLPRVEFPNALHVDFFNDSLKVESLLDAKYGRYLEGQKKMYLRDSIVVIQRFNQDTLRCRELWWDQNKEIFYTDKPVKITKKDGTVLPGQGLEASQDFRNIKIINPSQGILPVPESGFNSFASTDSSATTDSTPPRPRPFFRNDTSAHQ